MRETSCLQRFWDWWDLTTSNTFNSECDLIELARHKQNCPSILWFESCLEYFVQSFTLIDLWLSNWNCFLSRKSLACLSLNLSRENTIMSCVLKLSTLICTRHRRDYNESQGFARNHWVSHIIRTCQIKFLCLQNVLKDEKRMLLFRANTPMRRVGNPDEIAGDITLHYQNPSLRKLFCITLVAGPICL